MYIPSYFKENNTDELIEFIKAHNFATLISISNNVPIATHLPFVINIKDNKISLISHMAKANPQWQTFAKNELLIIFQGPHAYISPSNYEKQQNVPTWNYIAVHAYGKAKVIEEQKELISLMENTIVAFENKFMEQWRNLSSDYINNMLKAIVAFEIEVIKMEGKFKLSQNKTKVEQENIIHSLSDSEDTAAKGIADEMKKRL